MSGIARRVLSAAALLAPLGTLAACSGEPADCASRCGESGGATGATTGSSPTGATTTGATGGSGGAGGRGGAGGTSPGGFVHPGILVDAAQLKTVKQRLTITTVNGLPSAAPADASNASDKVSADAFNYMIGHESASYGRGRYSSLSYIPFEGFTPDPSGPTWVVSCASHDVSEQCSAQTDDAMAAYTDALIFYLTGDTAYADNAVKIINGWSHNLKAISFDTTMYVNGLLQAGWTAETITRAAEIVRHAPYGYAGWADADIARFSTMLTQIYLPMVNHGWTGGGANWLMSFADATIDIGVFTDDKDIFDLGVMQWQKEVPSIIYMSTDVNPYPMLTGRPIASYLTTYDKASTTAAQMDSYWHDPGKYIDGLEGETCRDGGHAIMGLTAMVDAAETARIQGVDLYGPEQARIVQGAETNALYFAVALNNPAADGLGGSLALNASTKLDPYLTTYFQNAANKTAFDQDLCGGSITFNYLQTNGLGWEIVYNAFHNRLGVPMPNTENFIQNYSRKASQKAGLFMDWEELTFGK